MKKILVTGACGQIGSELVVHLGKEFGKENVIATDIQKPTSIVKSNSNFMYLNVLDVHMTAKTVVDYEIDTIFHMAAILSARGEQDPRAAYDVNMQGLMNILETSRRKGVHTVITPSSIAAFGPDAPKENTPNETVLNPTTMYGVTKVAGEKLLQYYFLRYGLDARSLRYPGIISSETAPGGGTTDYAVDLYLHAVSKKPYSCFIEENTPLPFMYMPDAIQAILDLARAESLRLKRRVYNVNAMRLTPHDIVASIQKYLPDFHCAYQPDYRQKIARSWPHSIDDSAAREEWNWKPDFDLDMMTRDMLEKIRAKSRNQ
jgi:nucleoside-diphosphate-sugar epimerase